MNDPTLDLRCPRCHQNTVELLITTTPRCYRCKSCGHTWDEPYLRPVRDRRRAPEQP